MIDWTIFKLLSWTESYFAKHDVDSPRLTAEILLGHSLGIKRLELYLQHDRPLEKSELAGFKTLIKRRVAGEPVSYIIGTKGFYESEFQVVPGVLIPRPDTEILVETAVRLVKKEPVGPGKASPQKVLELGVGSGAIIVSLAKACPGQLYFAGDISRVALATAAGNAATLLEQKSGQKISFFQGYWLDALAQGERFHLILSNPPYIPIREIETLAPEIKGYEPRVALDGGEDGLDCIREILHVAPKYLVPGGHILMEMGFDQKDRIRSMAEKIKSVESVSFFKDLAGHHRVVMIKKRN